MKRNLIMGAIKDYGWYEIEPFFVSLKKNAGNVDCVIFYDDISKWTMEQLTKISYEDTDTEKTISFIEIPDSLKNKSIIDIRWSLYVNFLEEHKDEYEQILVTDIRDEREKLSGLFYRSSKSER